VTLNAIGFLLISCLAGLTACGSSGGSDQAPPVTGGGLTVSATLSWEPPTENDDGSVLTNLSAFRVIYGNSEANMNRTIDITNPSVSTYMVEGLAPGTYYFKVRAINDQGIESFDSKTVSIVLQ
jgi:hypothetical protein